ncbi:MAG: AraC family transcriptional regulator [Acidobacteriota bacterium]|nr:AraC family transcriptional regulator [Acidobacteriota bacterium]
MPNLAQLAALPVAGTSRPPATEVLTSPKSISSKNGTFVAEVQMPFFRKRSNADGAVASARWRAVYDRDRAADGSFVFAVKTTGVYCRPSCPARRPRPENVDYFADGAAARAAGFRGCRRCRPDEVPAIERAVAEARRIVDRAEGESVPLTELAEAVGLSPAHLQREFKRRIGLSPKQYGLAHRAERLKRELGSRQTVLDAGFEAGYGSASRIYDQAARSLGMTPGRFRDGGRGVRIAFATHETQFGHLLLATTDRGLCAVRLGGSAAAVRAELAAEFPRAALAEDGSGLAAHFDQIGALLAGENVQPVLDIEATAFQALVWQALLRIPSGTTTTYGELARAIGRPTAVRAVAAACGANPVALVVPCHRVVGRDGALTGYRWGVRRKRALLAAEAAQAAERVREPSEPG